MSIDKTKFWWGMVGLVVLVLGGVNVHLFLLRNSIYNFIGEEAGKSNKMIENLNKIRDFQRNPQPGN